MSAFIDETIGITVENFDPFWGLEKLLPARIGEKGTPLSY